MLERIAGLFEALGARASQILWVSTSGTLQRARYAVSALLKTASHPDMGTVIVSNDDLRPTVEVKIFLHDHPPSPPAGRDERTVTIRVARRSSRPAILEFLEVAARALDVAHGGGMQSRDWNHASAEIDLVSVRSALEPGGRFRKAFDARHVREAHRKLRRLYPVTIIGSEIWSRLAPLPAMDNVPTVSDLGDCKVLTAWPELCDPRDPAFLRGTTAFREWLWPHTIRNPAVHVDQDPYEFGGT